MNEEEKMDDWEQTLEDFLRPHEEARNEWEQTFEDFVRPHGGDEYGECLGGD